MLGSHSPFGTRMLQLSSASAAGGGHSRQASGATMPCWVCAQAIEFHGRMRRRAASLAVSLPGMTGPLASLGSIAPTRERPRAECDGAILRKEAVEIAQGALEGGHWSGCGRSRLRPGQSRLPGLSTCPARACCRVYCLGPRTIRPRRCLLVGCVETDDWRATVVMAGAVLQP